MTLRPLLSVGLLALLSFPCMAQSTLTIVNHYDKALNYTININPQVLPDLPSTFSEEVGKEVSSQVLDVDKEAYIRVEDGDKHSAFWGVKLEKGEVKVYGYLSKGIAYSWKQGIVTFCTPDEYKKRKACL